MKILISSVTCEPFGGSEGIYGWYVIRALAKKHQCFVITHETCRKSIEEATMQGIVPNSIIFRYVSEAKNCHSNRIVARFQSWLRYSQFLKNILSAAEDWHREIHFDLAQHVTYTTWRVASPLWRMGVPFVWGPISGTEVFPASCYSSLSLQSRLFEVLRTLQTRIACLNPAVRNCARMAFRIPAPHLQAVEFLSALRESKDGVELCHNFFFPDSRMEELHRKRPAVSNDKPLRAFAAGNLEGRKGVAIALEAIALAKLRGVRVEYHVTSRGPELGYLKKLTKKLGLTDQVILGERFDAADFAEALASFDICLLPSLRDGAGLSIMEAMLAGCVPIVADWCGPAEFVTETCGFKVPVTNPQDMALDICTILCDLNQNRRRARNMGCAARERILTAYNETQFLKAMDVIYTQALSVKPAQL